MNWNKNMSIRRKFEILLAVSFLFISLFIFLYFPLKQKSAMTDFHIEKANILAQILAKTSSVGLLFDEASSVKTLLEALKEEEDIKFAMVLKKDKTEFSSLNKDKFNDYSSVVRELIGKKSDSFDDKDIIIEIQPVKSDKETIGYVVIGITKEEIDEVVFSSRITAFIISLVIFILGLGSIRVFFTKIVYNPIKELTSIANKLSSGDIDIKIESKTEDEIGQLEKSFISIVDSVKDQAQVAEKISNGDLTRFAKVKSEKDILSKSMNRVIETLKELICEVNSLTKTATEGKLSERGNAVKYYGGYKEIVQGINETLNAVIIPLKEGASALENIADGDLTIRITSQYNGDHQLIINSINAVAESLNKILSDVNEAISATSTAATQISSTSEEIASGGHDQSIKTSEVASAVEEMTKTILESTKFATIAADNSKLASENAKKGAMKVEETNKGMQKIVMSTKATGEKISSLTIKTDQIGEIAQVIDDIADQTNLLALNAAIEAARAGDQGRGFAVVADEVRKLAERTTKATKEIAETIKSIQKKAKEADIAMEEAEKAVEEGMRLTEEVAESLQRILNVNEKVSDIINQVAAGSEEQSIVAEDISKNVEVISTVTQQSATGTDQIAKAAEDLTRLTINLEELVAKFKLSSSQRLSNYSVRQNGKLVH